MTHIPGHEIITTTVGVFDLPLIGLFTLVGAAIVTIYFSTKKEFRKEVKYEFKKIVSKLTGA